MSDALGFAELDRQHVELLPARTVLSGYGGGPSFDGHAEAGDGGDGKGGIGVNALNINVLGEQANKAADGVGGDGGNAVGNLLDGGR